jgi:hypothetical protein
MARLHEYQGKAILAANGYKIPRGRAASTADQAVAVANELADGSPQVEAMRSTLRRALFEHAQTFVFKPTCAVP